MNLNPHLVLASIVCLLLISVPAPDKPKKCLRPTTDGKKLMGTISISNQKPIEIVGKATFAITAINSDESLEGILIFALPDEERQKIAQSLNKSRQDIPTELIQKDVIGQFHKLTECPVLQLDFPSMELEMARAKVNLERFTLNLKETDNDPTIALCVIARQIKKGIGGRYSPRRFNELLNCQAEKD